MRALQNVGPLLIVVATLGLGACSGGDSPNGVPGTWVMERDAARAYLNSRAAVDARRIALAEIMQTGTAAQGALIDAYLEDADFRRDLTSKYSDYLLEMLTANEIEALRYEDEGDWEFGRQVAMHRFVLAQALVDWHVARANLDQSTLFDDPLVNTLATVLRDTPEPLIPQSRLG